jgi:hypothetical protein
LSRARSSRHADTGFARIAEPVSGFAIVRDRAPRPGPQRASANRLTARASAPRIGPGSRPRSDRQARQRSASARVLAPDMSRKQVEPVEQRAAQASRAVAARREKQAKPANNLRQRSQSSVRPMSLDPSRQGHERTCQSPRSSLRLSGAFDPLDCSRRSLLDGSTGFDARRSSRSRAVERIEQREPRAFGLSPSTMRRSPYGLRLRPAIERPAFALDRHAIAVSAFYGEPVEPRESPRSSGPPRSFGPRRRSPLRRPPPIARPIAGFSERGRRAFRLARPRASYCTGKGL